MAKTQDIPPKRTKRPALTKEVRESQLISLAVDLAEKQLIEGTASSQVITHFLKLGTTREELEKEKLKKDNLLIDAKIESMKSVEKNMELYKEAIEAMKRYSGNEDEYEDEYEEDHEKIF